MFSFKRACFVQEGTVGRAADNSKVAGGRATFTLAGGGRAKKNLYMHLRMTIIRAYLNHPELLFNLSAVMTFGLTDLS